MNRRAEELTLITIVQLVLVGLIVVTLYGWASGGDDLTGAYTTQAHSANALLLAEAVQIRQEGVVSAPITYERSSYVTSIQENAIAVNIDEQAIRNSFLLTRTQPTNSQATGASALLVRSHDSLRVEERSFGRCALPAEQPTVNQATVIAQSPDDQALLERTIRNTYYQEENLEVRQRQPPHTPTTDLFLELRRAEDTQQITAIAGAGTANDRLLCVTTNELLGLAVVNQQRQSNNRLGLILTIPEDTDQRNLENALRRALETFTED